MRLEKKVAIITGGGAGIGKAISLAFADEGADVVVAARTLSKLEETAGEIRSKGVRAMAIQADISEETQVQKVVNRTLAEYGRIDILVNNAAITGATANVVDIKLEDWNKELAVGLTGTMLCSKAVLKPMIAQQSGNIVNISSGAGRGGYPMRSPYSVIKWGVISLTQSMAMEVGTCNIRVNSVAPGWVEGERVDRAVRTRSEATGLSYDVVYEEVVQAASARSALRRIVTPDEVAGAVVFLASDESNGITGHTLDVNGGGRL
ncbi:SDR family NAD(P)-dependent oxidoreductase [Thermodesulfobacteriota bacterium]